MNDPVKYLMDHKLIILDAYKRDSSPKKSWNYLCEQLSDLESSMKFNTFKVYYRPFVLIVREYEERENHIAGWSIARSKDGYYRGNRRLHGKLYSVYLGKEYDRDAFTEKIKRKEQSMKVSFQPQPRTTAAQERPLIITRMGY